MPIKFEDTPSQKEDWSDKVAETFRTAPVPAKGSAPIVGGALSELTKGVGGLTELIAPEFGGKITKIGRAMGEPFEEQAPGRTTLGRGMSYVAPFKAATGAVQKGRELAGLAKRPTTLPGRVAETGAIGTAIGAGMTPGDAEERAKAGLTTGLLGAGFETIPAAAKFVTGFRMPESLAPVKGLTEVGAKIKSKLSGLANKAYEARATEASENYGNALRVARDKQVTQPFAESPQGRALLQSLENEKYVVQDGKKLIKGEEQVKGLDALINAIKGITKGGEKVPVGKGLVSSKVLKETPRSKMEKDITSAIEELRFLRDKANTSGAPAEKYAALQKEYRDSLINKLEQALYQWSDEYRLADEAYKAASRKLDAFKTETMARALRGEKFDFRQLAASDEEFAKTFFKNSQTVRELKNITGNAPEIKNLAKEYTATVLANQSPAQIKSFVSNPNNQGWMREAGIYDDVVKYARQVEKAASKQEILKKIGYGALGAAGYETITKTLGL